MWSVANHQPHPEIAFVEVFVFLKKEIGRDFIGLLSEAGIESEFDEEPNRLLVGVRRPHIQKAIAINNALLLERKKGFIPNKVLRWTVLGVFFVFLCLAIVGYILA